MRSLLSAVASDLCFQFYSSDDCTGDLSGPPIKLPTAGVILLHRTSCMMNGTNQNQNCTTYHYGNQDCSCPLPITKRLNGMKRDVTVGQKVTSRGCHVCTTHFICEQENKNIWASNL